MLTFIIDEHENVRMCRMGHLTVTGFYGSTQPQMQHTLDEAHAVSYLIPEGHKAANDNERPIIPQSGRPTFTNG